MTVKTGAAWSGLIVTKDSTGALATPSVGPAGSLYVNGTANAGSVTVSGSNPYKWTVTLPTLSGGDRVSMYITATIAAIATASVVAEESADLLLVSEIPASAAGSVWASAARTLTAATNITSNGSAIPMTAGNLVSADMTAISTDTTAADIFETMLDGTGGGTFSLGQLNIVASANNSALVATGSGTGNGISATGGATNGHGLFVQGAGSGEGLHATAGAGANAHGAHFEGVGANSSGALFSRGGVGGDDMSFANNDVTIQTVTNVTNVTGSVAGSVVGSVGSVVGAVGSVTGSIGGSVTGSVGSVVGAVGSVTGSIGGSVTGSVASVAGAVNSVTLPVSVSGGTIASVTNPVVVSGGTVDAVTGNVTVGTNNDKTGYTITGGTVTTLIDPVTVGVMGTAALTDFFDVDSGLVYADAIDGSVVKEIVSNTSGGGGGGATAAQVWAYSSRTLTQTAAQVASVMAGSTLTIQRGDTLSASITGLGAITGYTSLDFTIKSDRDNPDSKAILRIRKNASATGDGLITLNGAAYATAAHGSITLVSQANGDITINVSGTATALLPAVSGLAYDIQKIAGGTVTTMTDAVCNIIGDVTRLVS